MCRVSLFLRLEEPTADPEKPSSRTVKFFMKEPLGFLPKARRQGIITKEVDGELLIYDLERDKAHCLNPSAAAIWKLCDGHRTVSELTLEVSQPLGTPIDEDVIQLGVKELGLAHLLTEGIEEPLDPFNPDSVSRRALVQRLGVAAVLLPLITSITAPTALATTSNCIPVGQACPQTGRECCAGSCQQNGLCM
jgi:hypothetical protein